MTPDTTKQANKILHEAVRLRRSILEKSNGIDNRKYDLCVSLENLGETYVDRGDVDQGLDQYRQAITLHRSSTKLTPGTRAMPRTSATPGWRSATSSVRMGTRKVPVSRMTRRAPCSIRC